MARRGAYGEGSVYQRGDGRWVASVRLPSGRRAVRYPEQNTQRAAAKLRRDMLGQVEAGLPLPSGRVPTVGEYLTRWLELRIEAEVEAGQLRRTTADSYERTARIHILPTPLAQIRVDQLTPDDVRAWQRERLRAKSARGTTLSPRTVAMAQATLRRALGDGVRDGVIGRNPAGLVPAPRGHVEVHTPDEDELARVLGAAVDDRWRALWLTILGLGLRKGEALAMRWSKIDFKRGTVRLDRQVVYERGRLVEAPTKTRESKGTMLLPAALVEVLREHQAVQRAQRERSPLWADADLVFTSRVGTPLWPRNVNRAWAAVCQRAGVAPIRVHDLRHAAATLAFTNGATIKEVQAMLRHTRSATTADIYVHVLDEVRAGTAARMDGILRRLAGG